MCHHHRHVCQPSLALSPGRSRHSPISSPFHFFEFNRSTPRTFYPPHTYLPNIRSLLSQSGLLFPSLHVLPSSRSFILTFAFLYSIPTFLLTYLPSHPYAAFSQPPPLLLVHQPPANTFSKYARAKTYCLKYSLPPATLSLSLPRRRLGRTRW